MADLFDPYAFLAGDEPTAAAQSRALAKAMQGQRATGYGLTALLGDRRALSGLGGSMVKDAEEQGGEAARLGVARLHYQPQMEDRALARQAMQNPATAAVLRTTLGTFLPELAKDPNIANAPPQVLQTLLGPAEKAFGARESAAARRQQGSLSLGIRQDQFNQKLADNLQKDLDAAGASSRSAFGQSANVVFRGARNLALLKQVGPDGKPRQLTPQEWQEVSAGLVAMQTGGVPPEKMTMNATPKDLAGNAASIMSWLTAKPYAPDRQAWIDRFTQNIQREEDVSKQYMRETQLQRLGRHQALFKNDPYTARSILQRYGLQEPAPGGYVDLESFGVRPYEAPAAAGGATAGPKRISSDAEFEALPSGAQFVGPDGKLRRKP